MANIGKIAKVIERFIIEHTTRFREIDYFHPDGKHLPNGSHYEKGGFLAVCSINRNSFVLDEGIHSEQYGLGKYKGGVIVFSTDGNAVTLSNNILINKVKQLMLTFNNRLKKGKIIHNVINIFNVTTKKEEEKIGAYSVGNYFKGKYVGANGEMYNEKSLAVEINGISSRHLLEFAEMLAKEVMQETVLVKELNLNKLYLADTIPVPSDKTVRDELTNVNKNC